MPDSNEVEYPTEATIGNQQLRGLESQSREVLALIRQNLRAESGERRR